jgi:NhaB family Na+:H+ antiporter
MLAVAINTGTNLPSVATPNGQAAPVPADSRWRRSSTLLWPHGMDGAALHLVLTLVGLLCVEFTLMPVTNWLLAHGG